MWMREGEHVDEGGGNMWTREEEHVDEGGGTCG